MSSNAPEILAECGWKGCNGWYPTRIDLRRHQLNHVTPLIKKEPTTSPNTRETMAECGWRGCNGWYPAGSDLRRHQMTHVTPLTETESIPCMDKSSSEAFDIIADCFAQIKDIHHRPQQDPVPGNDVGIQNPPEEDVGASSGPILLPNIIRRVANSRRIVEAIDLDSEQNQTLKREQVENDRANHSPPARCPLTLYYDANFEPDEDLVRPATSSSVKARYSSPAPPTFVAPVAPPTTSRRNRPAPPTFAVPSLAPPVSRRNHRPIAPPPSMRVTRRMRCSTPAIRSGKIPRKSEIVKALIVKIDQLTFYDFPNPQRIREFCVNCLEHKVCTNNHSIKEKTIEEDLKASVAAHKKITPSILKQLLIVQRQSYLQEETGNF